MTGAHLLTVATDEIFATGHIAATAVISGALAALAAVLLNGRDERELWESLLVGVLTAAAVFLWRKSANVPALNHDGIPGFSANDWLAPTLTFVFLGVYRNLRSSSVPQFARTHATATVIALAVNVVTI
jgi:hypothetical protein